MTAGTDVDGPGVDGIVVVDKPSGWTSHDVVARARRILGTRKVGHAGTLDPMATGVLVLGVGRGTRLLGHLALTDKVYEATIRLGVTTTTDDADGEVVDRRVVTASPGEVAAAMRELTGPLQQVPSSVSAIKVNGVRSYARVRAGETVELAARPVTVHRFDLLARRDGVPVDVPVPVDGVPVPVPVTVGPVSPDGPAVTDLDVTVACSTGTYVRALARDLGARLGCGGHLTALRRTSVGPFEASVATGLDAFGELGRAATVRLSDAVAASFPRRVVDAEGARDVSHGRRLPAVGLAGTYGVFDPDGVVLALAEESGGTARPLVVFAPA